MNVERKSLRASFTPSFGSDLRFQAPIFWLIAELGQLMAFQIQGGAGARC